MKRPAARFLGRRFLALLGVLLAVSAAVFVLQEIAPGSAEQALIGTRPISEEGREALREKYNLDAPVVIRYFQWLGGAIRFDFGTSVRTGEPVRTAVTDRALVSVQLALTGMLIALAIGIPLGILAALRRGGSLDRILVASGTALISLPAFVSGLLLIYVFSVSLGLFPAFGQGEGLADRAEHLLLPALAASLTVIGLVMRVTRSALVDILEQEYVLFARARGLSKWRILTRYSLRSGLLPVVTSTGLILGFFMGGLVLVEVTYSISGIGSLLVEAIAAKDMPVIQGLTLTLATLIVAISALVDFTYPLLDPRVELEGGR